jgi:hypothetical protein
MSKTLKQHIHQLPSQFGVDCCSASAVLLAAEMLLDHKKSFSRLFLYYMARKIQGTKSGSGIKETLDALSEYGVPLTETWPFELDRINRIPNPDSVQEALLYRTNSYSIISTIDINNHLPVIIGMNVGQLFWTLKGPLEEQGYKPINSIDNKQSKGHAMVVVGYDDELLGGSWIVANSLGLQWGDYGYGIIPYSCGKDIKESYILNEFAGKTPEEKFLLFDK